MQDPSQLYWYLNGPTHFAGRRIKFRVPYTMPGELLVDQLTSGNFFPDATFLHNVELPFEIWRMYVRLTPVDADGNILDAISPSIGRRVRIRIEDTSKNQLLTKAPTTVDTLINSVFGAQGEWPWHIPYTIVRAEGFNIQVDTLSFANMADVDRIRVDISFQGFLTILEPPSETR